MEQVCIQALATYMVCTLNFGPVPWRCENASTKCVHDTFNDNRKERMHKAQDSEPATKKRENPLAFPLEYRTTGTWQMKMTGDQDQRS